MGYTGGKASSTDPTYKEICTGTTEHAEAVRIEFDETKTRWVTWLRIPCSRHTHPPLSHSFAELLDVFFDNHDPTTTNRQGPDVGSQYRSAIFYTEESQKTEAEASIKKWSASFSSPIVTQVVPEATWYPAEDYHQKYLEKKGHDS